MSDLKLSQNLSQSLNSSSTTSSTSSIQGIQNDMLSSFSSIQNEQPGIIEVYEDNFVAEIKNMSKFLEEYNYIGMDTEFPGTVYCVNNYTEDFYYRTLKLNVDKLKLIQLGITLTNSKGEYPKDYPYHTWQFNLEFDMKKDNYASDSLKLLLNCGIDFNKLKRKGIKHKIFAEYLMISGLVLNPNTHWVSFHGSYDFGYLLKLLINEPLPALEDDFTNKLILYFPSHYDIRILVQGNDKLRGGLNRLAQYLEVLREGKTHQAGSDSVVTIDVFFKLLKSNLVDKDSLQYCKNILFGIGKGADNNETICYTKIGNNDIYNQMLYMQMLNSNGYMNINYYNNFNPNNSLMLNANGNPSQINNIMSKVVT
jgi:CCR4-NOT transcription complex subunit 7/8